MTKAEFIEKLEAFNNTLKHYVVAETKSALQEDGRTRAYGYAVINTITGISEHTTTVLPGAFFQAQHLDGMLDSLLKTEEETTGPKLVDMSADDIVPH